MLIGRSTSYRAPRSDRSVRVDVYGSHPWGRSWEGGILYLSVVGGCIEDFPYAQTPNETHFYETTPALGNP
jgi:hypothetical protein